MPPTPVPDAEALPAAALDDHGFPPTDVTFEGRMQWPFLSADYVGNRVSNGRELGQWLAGHFFGRQMHGEPGLRVEVPEAYAAGVAHVLLDHGLIVQRFTFNKNTTTLDVWAF